jgi:two-component system, OmpR family, alkaline phosphatase synthesis response regulator PhoP
MKKKILLVDDEKDLVRSVTFRLEDAGYEVVVAWDGQEALEKTKSEMPDLIILDLMLPKMNGYKVCGLLKADSRYNRIPILMFTARAQEADRRMSEEVGADAYVTKPFEPEILFAKIEELLARED